MAPALRGGRTARCRAAGGGGVWPANRRDSRGGCLRCWPARWRRPAATGMLAQWLLSVGMLSLLVRCASAAEERNTYDASGSSSLQTDLAATATPARPPADQSVAEVVPLSDGGAEGLPGKPAFSSVLTVMAGTVKHPASLDEGGTLPTITKDETHTTQWPSQSSSYGSKMSSSSGGERISPASAGLAPSLRHWQATQTVTVTPSVSGPSRLSSTSSSSMSALALSNSPLLSPAVPQFPLQPSAAFVNKSASPTQSQKNELSLPTLRKNTSILPTAGYPEWVDILTTTHADTRWVFDRTDVTERTQSATNNPHFPTDTSVKKAHKVSELHSFLPVDEPVKASGTQTKDVSRSIIDAPATSSRTLKSTPPRQQSPHQILQGTAETQNSSLNSASSDNLLISPSVPTNHEEAQAVQRQLEALQNPTSARLSAHPNSFPLASSHATQQMRNGAPHADSQTSVDKGAADAITWRVNSHVVNPALSLTVRTPLPETSAAKPTPFHSGSVSSVHISNSSDLPQAARHGSPGAHTINVSYSREATVELERTSVSAHSHSTSFPSHAQSPWESISISVTGTDAPVPASELPHFPSNGEVKESQTQMGSAENIYQVSSAAFLPKTSISSNTGSLSPDSSPAVGVAQDENLGATHESFNRSTQPISSSTLLLSNYTHRVSVNTEISFMNQLKVITFSKITPPQASPLPSSPSYTDPESDIFPRESPQSVSSPDIPTLKPELSAQTTPSNFKLKIAAGGDLIPSPRVQVPSVKMPKEALQSISSPIHSVREDSTLIRDGALKKRNDPSGHSTTEFQSFVTTKHVFVLNQASEDSGKEPSGVKSQSPITFHGTLETPPHKDNIAFVGHYKQPSASTWDETIAALRTDSTSHSPALITSLRNNKSMFYFGPQPTVPMRTPTTPVGQQKSTDTFRAILSAGTNAKAQHAKWDATMPVPLTSSVLESESRSADFERTNSISRADGYTQLQLEDRQEHPAHILRSPDPTLANSNSYPTVGKHLSLTTETSSIKGNSLNSSPAKVGPAVFVDSSVQGLDGPLPFPHTPTVSLLPSQNPTLTLVHSSEQRNPSREFWDSFGNAAPSFSDINVISHPGTRGQSPSPGQASSPPSSLHPWPQSSQPSFTKVADLPKPITLVSHKDPSSSSTSLSWGEFLTSEPSMSIPEDPVLLTSSASLSVKAASVTPSSSPSYPNIPLDAREVTSSSVVLAETGTDAVTAGSSDAGALTFPKDKVLVQSSLGPSQSIRIALSAGATERTSQVSPLLPQQGTTTASVELTTATFASTTTTPVPATTTTTTAATTSSTRAVRFMTTLRPTAVTWRRTTSTFLRTQTSRRIFTPPAPRTSPPRVSTPIFISPFTTTTETPPQQCNITERLWVKTVVSIYVRRNRLDSIQRQNLRRGLSQGLRKALNDSSAQAQVETVFGSPNMTVAYHVTGRDTVYPPSVVLEGLESYGRDKLIADLRQYLPLVTALPLPVAPWRARPASSFQLKTVLQFVGAGDDPRSCRFSQMMEQRLQKVFAEAQAKVFNANSRLSVQMLSVSQAASSPAVSLVYSVRNGTVFLNGTVASNLLGQLSAELVGYFLFYPPLVIAEPMEYHNLNTSVATRDFWVITVIQDVDDSSLEGQYQSFASLMEQRLAELFVLAGQQGTRFRRAAAVGSYTVQMVNIRRATGSRNPAEMTYYVQHDGVPLPGTSAAKVLNTVDSQTMALTLGYFVQLQAESVVKSPPNNLWIIAAVLAPITVVTLIIIVITAVLCRKNKKDFKADAIGNLNPRAKMAYRRDMGYYHQPVQGFDYAKQHLGRQGGDEETLPASQDTLMMSLQIRDTPLALEKALQQDGTGNKRSLTSDKHKSKLPSEDGSVISDESERLRSGRGLMVLKVTAQQRATKEEARKKDDPYESSSGSLQLISIKPSAGQPSYSHPATSERSHDSAVVNGEVNLALKQKSDIEHYRNKLRLKAKRKGYYDFPSADAGSGALVQRHRSGPESASEEHGRPLEGDDERGSTYVKPHRSGRHSQVGQMAYRSRQSLSSPSPGGTEMDLLVMRERPRRGIRNSGYDTEPELIEETNVDRLMGSRRYMYGRGLKGHSETSSLSSQPSIDEVRQQMHLLLEEAFSLASGGQSTSGRHSHHHNQQEQQPQQRPQHRHPDGYSHPSYGDMVTSAPGTMSCGRGGLPWVPSYSTDVFQCSLPKPAFHFTQLPEIAMGSPPPLPPRTGPPPGNALRRSTSDLGPKGRNSEASVTEMQSHRDSGPCGSNSRAVVPSISAEQPLSNYSGNPITAVYAIPATRPGYSEYFVSSPSTSYHSPSWMSFPPEPDELPPQWADSLPLPGYVEAFPHPRYPLGSPTRFPLQYNQALEPPPTTPETASQQNLPQVVKDMDSMPLSSLSTSALVQAIRQEVAKLAKKQNDMFDF